jgi:hypothetical protein
MFLDYIIQLGLWLLIGIDTELWYYWSVGDRIIISVGWIIAVACIF